MAIDGEVKCEPTGDYAVGYCRPPSSRRFKKGHSGNPRGRPKGAKNLATYFDAILKQKVSVREGGHVKTMSKAEAMVHSVVLKAMKGDSKALSFIIALGRLSGQFDKAEKDKDFVGGVLRIYKSDQSQEEFEADLLKHQQELQALPQYVKYSPTVNRSESADGGKADLAKR